MAEKKTTKKKAEEAVPTEETAVEAVAEETVPEESAAEQAVEPEAAVEPAAEAEVPAEEPAAEAEPEAEPPAEEPAAEAEPEAEVPAEEPAAESEPAAPEAASAEAPAPAAPEAPAAPTQLRGPKPKGKRLPRTLRHTHTKPKRDKPAERKPIVRLPKPEGERGRRQERRGIVVSDAGDKTIVVKVDTIKAHPRYKKVVRRSAKFHAHDEQNSAKVGDVVRIVETRPISKQKHWRLAEIVEAAK